MGGLAKLLPGSLLVRVAIYAAIATVGVGGITATYFGWRSHQRMIGYQSALAAVAKQDQRAIGASNDAKRKVDLCYDNGGDFDVETGKCNTGTGSSLPGVSSLFDN